jgi:hypothetical protein
MMKPIVVANGQRTRKVPGFAALWELLMSMAAAGDMKAFQIVMAVASRERLFDELPPPPRSAEPTENIREVLARKLTEIRGRLEGHVEGLAPENKN